MNIIQKMFPGYMQSKEESLSAEEYQDFSEVADALAKAIVWIVLACIIVLLVRMDQSKSSRLTGKLYSLALIIPFYFMGVISMFRKLFIHVKDDVNERVNWIVAVFATSFLAVATTVIAVCDLKDMLAFGGMEVNKKEQIFVCDDINMKVTVPAGYLDIAYEDVGTENSVRWCVENETNVIWVYIYMDWSFTSTYENAEGETCSILDAHFDRFSVTDKAYFKGGLLAEPRMTEINSQPAFMSFGKRDTDNEYRFIVYRFLRNDALICVTYAFSPTLDQKEQEQIAYEFVSNMEFK